MKWILSLIMLLVFQSVAFSATEDYTTYTENDPGDDITITSAVRIDLAKPSNTAGYVRKDFGAGYFGDFVHYFGVTIGVSGNNLIVGMWAVNNGETTRTEMATNNKGIQLYQDRGTDGIYIKDFTNDNLDYMAGSQYGTSKYFTIQRSGTTLTVSIYSDAEKTTLVDTLSIVCGTDTYQYYYPTMHSNETVGYHVIRSTEFVSAVTTSLPSVLNDIYVTPGTDTITFN